MEKTTKLYLAGTAIEELPYSICNLTDLQDLHLYGCKHLKQLPTSIFMLPKLWRLRANYRGQFKKFSKYKGEEGEEMSTIVSSKRKYLILSNCNLSDESLSICLPCFPYLGYLDLSYNSFTILPACIIECHLLWHLSVQHCEQLRVIERLPPNLETFDAGNCTSLTSLSSDMLLKQEFPVAGRREFILPGQRVPEWFHHYSDGESMCFWVRGEFPALLLCFVLGVLGDKYDLFRHRLSMLINGIDPMDYCWRGNFSMLSPVPIGHIVLIDLQKAIPLGKLHKFLKDRWNQVEVFYVDDPPIALNQGKIKWSRVYVYEKENNKENIRFSRPSSTERTCHDSYDSNSDLELGCHPLTRKQRASLDIPHQQGETVYKDKGKNLLVNNDVNRDSNSMVPPSTSDIISGHGFLYCVKRLLFSCFRCFGL